jgi:DnaJ homolog subfamily B member 12
MLTDIQTVVSKAFQILSDADKKRHFDKYGGDPDSRHSAASAGASSFGRASAGQGGSYQYNEDEISPEEMFRQFFGGGMGGGFPGFGMFYSATLLFSSSNTN